MKYSGLPRKKKRRRRRRTDRAALSLALGGAKRKKKPRRRFAFKRKRLKKPLRYSAKKKRPFRRGKKRKPRIASQRRAVPRRARAAPAQQPQQPSPQAPQDQKAPGVEGQDPAKLLEEALTKGDAGTILNDPKFQALLSSSPQFFQQLLTQKSQLAEQFGSKLPELFRESYKSDQYGADHPNTKMLGVLSQYQARLARNAATKRLGATAPSFPGAPE